MRADSLMKANSIVCSALDDSILLWMIHLVIDRYHRHPSPRSRIFQGMLSIIYPTLRRQSIGSSAKESLGRLGSPTEIYRRALRMTGYGLRYRVRMTLLPGPCYQLILTITGRPCGYSITVFLPRSHSADYYLPYTRVVSLQRHVFFIFFRLLLCFFTSG